MDTMSWDYILKYVIVGDSAVGKSSILIRLTDDRFWTTEPTLGVEFGSRILSVGPDGKRVKVQCWDTAGTESFRSITRSYFRGAAGALLVYDVTRRDSFEHVTSWLKDLRAHADENVSIILVANKTDLCSTADPSLSPAIEGEDSQPEADEESAARGKSTAPAGDHKSLLPRAVSSKQGQTFAQENGLLYVETSAKEGWGVVDAFERTAKEVLRRHNEDELSRRKPGGVKLDKNGRKDQVGGCC